MNQITIFRSILTLLLLIAGQRAYSQCNNAVGDTVYVTTTNNTGASLRQAIQCVNSSTNIRFIHFNILGIGPFTITPTPAAPLPPVTRNNVVIDARTQPGWTLGSVIIDGTLDGNLGGDANGLEIQGNNVEVYGLFIREFDDDTLGGAGIRLISGNGAIIDNNVLSGNRHGVWSDLATTSATIRNNLIGLRPDETTLPNTSAGVQIDITFGANFSITENTIANNAFGVRSLSPVINVLVSQNSMYCNFGQAIDRSTFTISPFSITSANTTSVFGIAPGGTVVEVFKHVNSTCSVAPCQGNIFLGSVTVPIGTAAWALALNPGDVDPGDQITATATQNGNNTSEFLSCVTALDCTDLTVEIDKTDANCNLDNGSATANPSIIDPNLRFIWSNGATTQTISNLSPGQYIVTVIDGRSCQVSDTVDIEQLGAPTFNLSYNEPVCDGQTLILDAGVTGGTPDYSYSWTGPNGFTSSRSNPEIPNATALNNGNYQVVVTDSRRCSRTSRILTVTISERPTVSINQTDVSCNGAADGSLETVVNGGAPNYTYLWTTGATTPDLNNLTPDTYGVTVTDANGCVDRAFATITEPETLFVSLSATPASCGAANGTATATITGGTAPYRIVWSNGQTGNTATSLPGGIISVTVTDANDCTETAQITIDELPELSISTTSVNVLCNGDATGSIDLNIDSGTRPFTFNWSNGANTEDLNNLPAGTYDVQVTDANNCQDRTSVTITEPNALAISFSTTDISCNGASTGAIDLTITGGTAPYNISWSNGATTEDLANIPAGTYQVNITDANDCQVNGTVTINEPNVLNLSTTSTDATCGENNGTATASANGGTPPYQFTWSNGQTGEQATNLGAGLYTVSVLDANDCLATAEITINDMGSPSISFSTTDVNCNGTSTGAIDLTITGGTTPYNISWSNGATTEDLTNIPAGTYQVNITDGADCRVNGTVTINEPNALDLSVTSTDATCGESNGTAPASATGGTPPYRFTWSNGQTGEQATNLSAGLYTVSVLDANDCLTTAEVTINDSGNPSISFSTTDVNCNGTNTGAIDLSITGGTAPYNISWNNGSTTEDLTNIPAGTYQVDITDGAGCQVNGSVTINEPLVLEINIVEEVSTSSQDNADGQLIFEILGGTSPYSYTWIGPVNGNSIQGNPGRDTIPNLLPGDYTLQLSDNNDCRQVISFTIGAASSCNLNLDLTVVQNESCPQAEDGFIELITSGGTMPFNYQWTANGISGNGTGILIQNLNAGIYSITLTDQNNCSVTAIDTVETVNLPSPNSATLSECGVTGLANFDLTSVNSIVNDGSGLQVNWYSNAQTTIPIGNPNSFNSPNATVFATLFDQGCESSPVEVSLIVVDENDPSCNGGNCTTQAGTMRSRTIITLCPTEEASAIHNGDEMLDRNDVLEFILHTNANDQLGTILGRNETPNFFYNSTNMQTGITYYISAIAGNNLGNGQVDLNDPCLSIATGVAIVFTEDFSGVLNFIQGQDVLCQGQDLELLTNNLNDSLVTYHWILPAGDTLTSRTPRFTIPNVNESNEGEYFVFFTRGNCAFDLTGPLILEVKGLPNNQIVDAGADQISCDGTATLNAQPISEGNANWKSLSSAVLGDPLDPQSSVSGLLEGENLFVWTVSTGECGEIGSDTVSIIFQEAVFANDDAFLLERANTEIFMDVLKNDNVTPGPNIEITILNEPAFGIAEVAGNGIRYFEKEGLRGVVELTYQVCYFASNCQQPCDTANVRIDVLNLPFLPDGITPNNDGINDVLTVQGLIPGDPSVKMKLIITNRWGDIVFQSDDYSNEQPWGGRFQGSGKALPEGAYFCAIETSIDEEVYKETKIVYIVNSN